LEATSKKNPLGPVALGSAKKKRMSSTQKKKGQISGYVKHIRWKTPQISGVL